MTPILWLIVIGLVGWTIYDDFMRGGTKPKKRKRRVSIKKTDRS